MQANELNSLTSEVCTAKRQNPKSPYSYTYYVVCSTNSDENLTSLYSIDPRLGPAGVDCRAGSATSIACRVVLPSPLDRNGYIDGYEVGNYIIIIIRFLQ